jgi:hypothetical protein
LRLITTGRISSGALPLGLIMCFLFDER